MDTDKYQILEREFYERNSGVVAKELLGKFLVRKTSYGIISGRIVETEAYYGKDDSASHAARKKTTRNEVMFGISGVAYVYFIYGNYFLLNVVTEKKGTAGAVLLRSLEPVSGLEYFKWIRKVDKLPALLSGPAKLTQAFGITKQDNKRDLTKGDLYIGKRIIKENFNIKRSSRVGIKEGLDLLERYYIAGNPFISCAPRN
jgi:DNA-3-methyladenine glycosylase